jgi:hypothetical protein
MMKAEGERRKAKGSDDLDDRKGERIIISIYISTYDSIVRSQLTRKGKASC